MWLARLLYPVAWIRIRIPERRQRNRLSRAWFTAKLEADYQRRRRRWRQAGSPTLEQVLDNQRMGS